MELQDSELQEIIESTESNDKNFVTSNRVLYKLDRENHLLAVQSNVKRSQADTRARSLWVAEYEVLVTILSLYAF